MPELHERTQVLAEVRDREGARGVAQDEPVPLGAGHVLVIGPVEGLERPEDLVVVAAHVRHGLVDRHVEHHLVLQRAFDRELRHERALAHARAREEESDLTGLESSESLDHPRDRAALTVCRHRGSHGQLAFAF